jgi:hypothetical protein
MIALTKQEWHPIWNQIKQDYPRSVWMISYVLKRELGFTVRKHTDNTETEPGEQSWYDVPKTRICLDFYDEQLETVFRLKYL